MFILQAIANWATSILGLLALLYAGIWLAAKVFDRILLWLDIRTAFLEFLYDRQRCTCGAVGPKVKAVNVDLPGAPPKEGEQ